MTLIGKELKENKQYVLTFKVDAETFAKATDVAYKKNVKKMNVPGFRPGKAPRHVIEKMYGKEVFYNDAIDEVLPAAYEAAVKESELDVVGRPEIDVTSLEDGVTFTATVAVVPEVTIDGYKGMKVEKKVKRVLKKDVEEELEKVQKRNSRNIEVTDRESQMGDTVNLDYSGSVDGVKFEGGTAEGQTLVLGSNTFIPGFEDQVAGKKIGEEFDVNVTFPTEYGAKDLAGKAAVFACKLNGITTVELPALDDEFAKDVSEFDTLEEYKESLKKNLQEKNQKAADDEVEGKLCDALIEKVVADIPEVMFDAEVENFIRDYDNNMRMQGLDLNTYLKYVGQTLDQLRAEMRPRAEKQVKLRLALEAIAKLEKLTVTDAEIDAEYTRISEAYNVPVDQVKTMVAKEDIEKDMLVKAAMDFVKDSAVTKAPAKEKAAE